MVIDLLILAAVVVFVVDLSGFSDTLLGLANRLARPRGWEFQSLKPFTCSLCATWWLGLLYLAATHHLTLQGVGMVALVSLLTTPMANAEALVKESLLAVLELIYKLIGK